MGVNMTAKHISDGRQRRSKRYLEIHRQLRKELYKPEQEPSKQDRKRAASQTFRARGE